MLSISITLAAPSSRVGTDILVVALRLNLLVVGYQTDKEGGCWELSLVADKGDLAGARNGTHVDDPGQRKCYMAAGFASLKSDSAEPA
jgi:hypothetical protein